MTMQPPGFAMAHDLRAGHRLVLRFTTSDPDKVPTFAVDPRVTIATGPGGTVLQVPVVQSPALVEDTVPFDLDGEPTGGPAQPEETASVTPTAGAPERTPVTVAFHEFDVQSGFDNAALLVSAVPSMSADIDLYLQRQNAGRHVERGPVLGRHQQPDRGAAALREPRPRPLPGRGAQLGRPARHPRGPDADLPEHRGRARPGRLTLAVKRAVASAGWGKRRSGATPPGGISTP